MTSGELSRTLLFWPAWIGGAWFLSARCDWHLLAAIATAGAAAVVLMLILAVVFR